MPAPVGGTFPDPAGNLRTMANPGNDTTRGHRPNAAERLAAALGRPVSPPMSRQEAAQFEADQDRADAELERILGLRQANAA